MKILSAAQIREADAYTISHEPISSLALMERAGKACFEWIESNVNTSKRITVVCGTGNNGGDGLVIARLLHEKKYSVDAIVVSSPNPSIDFKKNLEAAIKAGVPINEINEKSTLHLNENGILIDAIFGTGISRPVSGWIGECIDSINSSNNEIISIDLPSGMFTDEHTEGKVICASHTLTFQTPKRAFFFAENEKYTGNFHILDIGLDKNFIEKVQSYGQFLLAENIKPLLKKRNKFSHKGNYGHSLLISGSKGKIGAAILAARACLRSGSGLLTVRIPHCGYSILQTAVPEAMAQADEEEDFITHTGNFIETMHVAVGPGIGTSSATKKMLLDLLERTKKPIVLDADAINIISENRDYINLIPPFSILTPHPKEFERLAGESKNDFERHEKLLLFSKQHKVFVVLKGAHTCIATPDGMAYFNSTGNPGMAKGGSGDALTGVILAFLSQGYEPMVAALLGVYIHGLAGDITAKEKGEYSMITSDLIENLPKAFNELL